MSALLRIQVIVLLISVSHFPSWGQNADFDESGTIDFADHFGNADARFDRA